MDNKACRGCNLRIMIGITLLMLLAGGAGAAEYNLSLGTWTGITDQGNILWFDVSETGKNYTITYYQTSVTCYEQFPLVYKFYVIKRNISNVPIINNAFNDNDNFIGTFTSPINASGNYYFITEPCRQSGSWKAHQKSRLVINSVTISDSAPNTGNGILVTVNVRDNVEVTDVMANSVSFIKQSNGIWNGTIIALAGTHSVNVSARDASGNIVWNNSSSYTATTPTQPPKTGDINGNGELTLVDAIYLAKHVGGFSGYERIYADGDINANGKLDLVDAIYLAKHVGGFSGYEKLY